MPRSRRSTRSSFSRKMNLASRFNIDAVEYGKGKNQKNDYFQSSKPFFAKSRQNTRVSGAVISSYPPGYPDLFYPEPVSFTNRGPTKKLLFESQLTDMIAPGFLQINDVTVFSSFRKDAFCTISKDKGRVILMTHKIMDTRAKLPFYKGNPVIIQNGFDIKIKNLNGVCVMTFKRKTMFKPNQTDILEMWLGNHVLPVGRVRKPSLVNEYVIYDDFGHPLFVIYKARSMTNSRESNLNFKYIIHRLEDKEIIGRISCKGRKVFGPIVTAEYPCTVEFQNDLTITQKCLLLGALFLIASRSHSGIERIEEKTRGALDMEEKQASDDVITKENAPMMSLMDRHDNANEVFMSMTYN